MLIEAGIRNDDQESINAGILKWSTVWPEDVVRQMSAVLIATIRSELASADASITNGIPE